MDRLTEAYRESDADWVLMPDADEFIFVPIPNHLKVKTVAEYLERRDFLDMVYVDLYRIYRHRTDEDLVLEKGIWQRRYGAGYFLKPIIVRSHKKFSWHPGFHRLYKEEPMRESVKYRLRGSHWTMADPCFCIERKVKQSARQSKKNLETGSSKHLHFITEAELRAECEAHLDDSQVF
jgi:hypothetical protein